VAGNTATIDVQAFRLQWDAGVPMAVMCSHWTITKDQLIRLKAVWELPLRHDRARKRSPVEDPAISEERASGLSLSLAPGVEARAALIRSRWTLEVEHSRRGTSSGGPSQHLPKIVSLAAIRATLAQSDAE
jgi:hypothetical protein